MFFLKVFLDMHIQYVQCFCVFHLDEFLHFIMQKKPAKIQISKINQIKLIPTKLSVYFALENSPKVQGVGWGGRGASSKNRRKKEAKPAFAQGSPLYA